MMKKMREREKGRKSLRRDDEEGVGLKRKGARSSGNLRVCDLFDNKRSTIFLILLFCFFFFFVFWFFFFLFCFLVFLFSFFLFLFQK